MSTKCKRSYLSSPMSSPYMYQTVPDRMRHLAAADPNREAFVFYDLNTTRHSLTRKQFLDKSVSLAKTFVELGITKGSHVAVCMRNSMELLVANAGLIYAGIVPVYMSANLKTGEDIADLMRDIGCVMLLIDASEGDDNWEMLQNMFPLTSDRLTSIPSLKYVLCNGKPFSETDTRLSLNRLLNDLNLEDAKNGTKLPDTEPEDTLAYFSTSGSTGKPKVFIYTHFALLNWTKQSHKTLNILPTSIYFCERPMTWHVGFPHSYLVQGCTRVFTDINLSVTGQYIETLCDVIERERCDVIYSPGYLGSDLLSRLDLARRFGHVGTIIMAGERIPKTFTGLVGKFCPRLYNWYCSGEAGGISACLIEEESFEEGLVGQPVEGYEVKVVDEHGSVVPINATGELLIRSAMRFTGYYNLTDVFQKTVDIRNWVHSGDIARIRADGNIVIEGRAKEQISIRTIKLFPWEIESVLMKCPGVNKAFVVGVPDDRSGQAVCACVLPKLDIRLTLDDIRAYCSEQFMKKTSCGVSLMPTYFLVLDNVPLTGTGKVDRVKVALTARQSLGL